MTHVKNVYFVHKESPGCGLNVITMKLKMGRVGNSLVVVQEDNPAEIWDEIINKLEHIIPGLNKKDRDFSLKTLPVDQLKNSTLRHQGKAAGTSTSSQLALVIASLDEGKKRFLEVAHQRQRAGLMKKLAVSKMRQELCHNKPLTQMKQLTAWNGWMKGEEMWINTGNDLQPKKSMKLWKVLSQLVMHRLKARKRRKK